MTDADPHFILASRSPRRADLLARLGYRFVIEPADIDETPGADELPADFVCRLAREKACAGQNAHVPTLGADTIVVCAGEILGKPRDRADAMRMLALLSGTEHEVMTAVSVCHGPRLEQALSVTRVCLDEITPQMASAYWASGESAGKAGAYAIQGLAEVFVREIHGSYSGVVGLPLQQTASLLKLFDIQPPALGPATSQQP